MTFPAEQRKDPSISRVHHQDAPAIDDKIERDKLWPSGDAEEYQAKEGGADSDQAERDVFGNARTRHQCPFVRGIQTRQKRVCQSLHEEITQQSAHHTVARRDVNHNPKWRVADAVQRISGLALQNGVLA